MYINIGGGEVLKKKKIIGIFDMDTATVARQTKIFLRSKETEGSLVYVSRDIPKSFILCDDRVVVCDPNTSTLGKRVK